MRVLVTGSTGFVGRVLTRSLAEHGHSVRAALRVDSDLPPWIGEKFVVGDISVYDNWAAVLDRVDVVIHAAGRAHVLDAAARDSSLYFAVNEGGTRRIAESAARAGVKKLVFFSSIKVNGEISLGAGFTPLDQPRPVDPYGISKWLGEKAVRDIGAKSDLRVIVLRPPLVYGPGVRANFLRLMKWVDAGWPLPFAAIDNRRSLVSVWNLCDLVVRVIGTEAADGGTWMISDGEDHSTPELVRRIGSAMKRRVRLFPVPERMLRYAGTVLHRSPEVARLCGSLQVDIGATRRRLDWSPPLSFDESLARTVDWYLSTRQST